MWYLHGSGWGVWLHQKSIDDEVVDDNDCERIEENNVTEKNSLTMVDAILDCIESCVMLGLSFVMPIDWEGLYL